MNTTKTIILKGNIDNNLQFKLILIIIYIKNNWLTKAF